MHRGWQRRKPLPFVLCALLAAFGVSCGSGGSGGSAKASLAGKITYRGSPIAGIILLESEEGAVVARSALNPDGTYLISDSPVGKIKVRLAFSPRHLARSSSDNEAREVAARYNDPAQSGLTVEVHPGKNEYSMDLQ